MSGALSAGLSVLGALADWRNDLQPASFRGVPFEVEALGGEYGRRKAIFEFPGRDIPYVEDLGRAARRHQIRGFVLGNDYMGQRDDLLEALEEDPTPGLLIHPTLGRLVVGVLGVRTTESRDKGGMCAFDIEFIEDGPRPSPLLGTDTASALLRGIVQFARLAQRVYRFVSLVISDPLYVLSLQGGLLGLAARALRALPPGSIGAGSDQIDAISATPADDEATIVAVAAAFDTIADNVIEGRAVADPGSDPVAGLTVAAQLDADPSGGLIALALWGDDLPAITGTTAEALAQATQQAATVAMIRAHALAAITRVYGSITWPHAQAATDARGQLLALFDAQATAAADAGHDDLYRALAALETLAMADMTGRAQALPRLDRYALGVSLPSDVLAYRLYQDAGRMAELEALNNVEHPLFMPETGLRLVAA